MTSLLTLTTLTLALTSVWGDGSCDNGKVAIWRDWNPRVTEAYTCDDHDSKGKVNHRPKGQPSLKVTECTLQAQDNEHKCMSETISYSTTLPTSGASRPVGPTYGEYQFIPVQRWMHALAHGGVVMLYHPCADPEDVELVKEIVQGCLRRHIISPYTGIGATYNFALLAWKCKFVFSSPSVAEIVAFVKLHAKQGPKNEANDGGYRAALLKPAGTVSDLKDSYLCPTMAERKLLQQRYIEESFHKTETVVPKKDNTMESLAGAIQKLKDLAKKEKFDSFNSNIIDLGGKGGDDVSQPSKELVFDGNTDASFKSNIKDESFKTNFKENLMNEEKKLESDLQMSEEKLAEIREEIEEKH